MADSDVKKRKVKVGVPDGKGPGDKVTVHL